MIEQSEGEKPQATILVRRFDGTMRKPLKMPGVPEVPVLAPAEPTDVLADTQHIETEILDEPEEVVIMHDEQGRLVRSVDGRIEAYISIVGGTAEERKLREEQLLASEQAPPEQPPVEEISLFQRVQHLSMQVKRSLRFTNLFPSPLESQQAE